MPRETPPATRRLRSYPPASLSSLPGSTSPIPRNPGSGWPGTDWLLTPESLQDDARKYLDAPDPSCSDLRDPYVSPRYAELRALPPMLVHIGGDELLRDDIHAFVRKARASGIKVCLDEWPGMFHDWHLMASYLPEGRKAVDEIGVFYRIMLA